MPILPRIYAPPPTGYELNPDRGFFSVIVAEETENLVTNPSIELDTTGFNDLALGTIERSEEQQAFGAFSLKYTPNAALGAGVYYRMNLVSETLYTASVYVLCVNSTPYEFHIYDGDGSYVISSMFFQGLGRWQRLVLTGTTGAGSSDVSDFWIVIRKNQSASTTPFYLDGLQVEQKGYATTYADGDMVGLIPGQKAFYWTGTRHASTSVRIVDTNAGGRIRRIDETGFKLIGMVGLGMPPVSNITSPLALTGGSSYQRTIPNQRPFTLVGDLSASSLAQLQRQRNALLNLLKPTTIVPQPIMLRYQLYNCKDPISEELEIPCVYSAGLEANTDNAHHERLSIQLLAMTPYLRRVMDSSAVSLDAVVNVPGCDFVAQRKFDLDGPLKTSWTPVALGTDGIVRASLWGPDGKLYIVGDFTNAIDTSGPVLVNYVAMYDPLLDLWFDVGTGADDIIRCLAFDSIGRLYVGGDFTNIGGGPPVVANKIAYWDGLNWNAMGAPTSGVAGGDVYTIAIDAYNNVYAGGDFTSAGGTAVDRVAYWDGATWAPLVTAGTGPNLRVRSIQIDLESDDVYIVGEFGTFSGLTVDRTAKYIPSSGAVEALGSGVNNAALCSLLLNGKLYVGGSFTEAGGNDVGAVPAAGLVAVWDGATWSPMAGGLGGGVANVFQIGFDPKYGEMFFVGAFSEYYQSLNAAPVEPLDGFVGWNGVAWFQPDVDLPGAPTIVYSVSSRQDGRMIVGYDIAGNAVTTNLLILTNNGSADAYPRVFMYGEGTVYQLINYTTGEAIYFDNVTVLPGEIIILDLTPGLKTMTSNIRGNLLNRIAAGSDLATWRLKPGDNIVSVHLPNAFAEISVFWKDSEWSIDGAV